MSNVSKRILARRAAVQILYQSEITGVPADKLVDEGLVPEEAKANEYARELVCGVSAHRAELDRAIGESSQNWAIDRMPVVDRSVLRLAVYEMRYVDDVPQSVAINEAVELAKAFGGEDDSHRFVNGILGRLARLSESEQGVAAEAPTEEASEGVAEAAPAEIPTMGILSDFTPAEANWADYVESGSLWAWNRSIARRSRRFAIVSMKSRRRCAATMCRSMRRSICMMRP